MTTNEKTLRSQCFGWYGCLRHQDIRIWNSCIDAVIMPIKESWFLRHAFRIEITRIYAIYISLTWLASYYEKCSSGKERLVGKATASTTDVEVKYLVSDAAFMRCISESGAPFTRCSLHDHSMFVSEIGKSNRGISKLSTKTTFGLGPHGL